MSKPTGIGRGRKAGQRRPVWTEEELARAQEMRRSGSTYAQIADALGRGASGVEFKLKYPPRLDGFKQAQIWAARPSDALERERLARQEASDRQDLTGAFCGDPPPGFSALDRKADSCVPPSSLRTVSTLTPREPGC